MWQTASDFLVFLGWVWQNIIIILKDVFLPVQYIFTFIYQFFVYTLKPAPAFTTIWSFPSAIVDLFYSVPYFNVLVSAAMLGITIIFVMFILKSFSNT